MMSKSKVPQIRFKGFSEEWELDTVGTFYNFKNGLNKGKEFFGYGTPIVNFTDVFHNRSIISNNLKGKVSLSSDEISNYNVKEGDIFFTRTSETINEIGYPSVMTDSPVNTVFSGFVLRARAIDLDPLALSFKQYVFFTDIFRSEMVKKSSMTTRALTSGTAIKQMLFTFPKDKNEQTKIGNYFQKLDKLIEQKEKKYQKLKQFKKAMLDKMFPKNGANTPEIRFKGFSGKWAEKALEEIVDRYDNLRIPISASNRIAGDTPYYGANGIQDYVQGFTHDGEFILVAEDGANDLKNYPVQYVNGKIWVNNHAHVLQAKKDISSNKFLKYSISKINIEPFLVGGGRAKLNANIMMKINIYVPLDIQEQEKIGNYFQKLDNQIDLQQKELEKLKNIKKASLSKMFV